MKELKMFKTGQFIVDKDTNQVYKIVKITKIGCQRCYILRPKGKRNDYDDQEYSIPYVNENFILAKNKKPSIDEAIDLIIKGKL